MNQSRNALGRCQQCQGKLLTKGSRICCGQCGLPVPDHPLAAQLAVSGIARHTTREASAVSEDAAPFVVGPSAIPLATPLDMDDDRETNEPDEPRPVAPQRRGPRRQ